MQQQKLPAGQVKNVMQVRAILHWLAMDLGEVKTVNSVIITWERRNPTNYAIETSEDGSTWKAVKTFTSAPAEKEQIINLDNPVQTRYIRVRINTFNPTAEGITWKTVSIYEFEVYGEKQSSGVKSGML